MCWKETNYHPQVTLQWLDKLITWTHYVKKAAKGFEASRSRSSFAHLWKVVDPWFVTNFILCIWEYVNTCPVTELHMFHPGSECLVWDVLLKKTYLLRYVFVFWPHHISPKRRGLCSTFGWKAQPSTRWYLCLLFHKFCTNRGKTIEYRVILVHGNYLLKKRLIPLELWSQAHSTGIILRWVNLQEVWY